MLNSLEVAFQGSEQQNGDLAESRFAKDRPQERWVLVYIYILYVYMYCTYIFSTQCHKYCICVGKCAGTMDEKATRKKIRNRGAHFACDMPCGGPFGTI